MTDDLARETFGPALTTVVDAVLAHWPEHLKFLRASFRDRSATLLATSEEALLATGGSVWINEPANGLVPDHLFLLRGPDEAIALIESVGLRVERSAAFPIAGSSLDRALRQQLPISCCITDTRTG